MKIMKTMKRLLAYMWEHSFMLVIVLVSMIVGSACSVRATYYLKPLINDCLIPLIGQEAPDYSEAMKIFILIAVMYGIAVTAKLIQSIIMVSVSNRVMYRIRNEMFCAMQKLPLQYFDTHSRGETMSYYSADVDALSQMLRQGIPRIVEGITTIITIVVTILTTNLRMSAVVIGCVACISLILGLLSGNKSKHFKDQQDMIQELNSYGEEMISGRAEVKAFSHEAAAAGEFAEINGRLYGSMTKADFFADSMFTFASGLSYVGYTAVAVIGCLMSFSGITDAGTVGVFLQYYRKLYAPVTRISKQVSNMFSAVAGAERIFAFLDLEAEVDEGAVHLVKNEMGDPSWVMPDGSLKPCRGNIEFSHVDFAYSADGPTILHDLSLSVGEGKTVAIVGTTGAGKTTVVNLLSRFYEISSGRITLDGIDVKEICKEDLRHAAGAVLQDVHLFSMSVKENIRFGNADADDNDIKKAAEVANAGRFIELLEDGYDTVLVHGGEALSQGQKQLLAIARASAGQFPVLVLDEATSSIDSRTELLVSRGLDALMKDKTVIVIAHRLSTIKDADCIVVLDAGRIAESGTHSQLMERKGIYYGLYRSTTGAAC